MKYGKTHVSLIPPARCGLVILFVFVSLGCSLFEGTVAVDIRSPLTVPRIDLGAATADGLVYAIGGYTDHTVPVVEVYNPQTDSWTRKADMPTPRRLFALGAINGIIYVTGGMDFTDGNNVTYVYTTEAYDPATDTWSTGTDLPMATPSNSVFGNAFMYGVVLQNRLYVVVYNTGEPGVSALYVYDPPPADSWSSRSAPPLLNYWDSYESAAAECRGKIYVFQGGGLAEYDPSTDSWEVRTEALYDHHAGVICAQGDRLYAFGGIDDGYLIPSVEVYRPDTGLWANQGWLANPRACFACVTLDDESYLVGGSYSPSRYSPKPLGIVERVTLRQ